jgi:hypothetical protein
MAVAPRKAGLVTARELPNLVQAAVKAAHAKVPKATPLDESAITIRWELIGRILRERDLGVAQSFADAVVAELKAQNVAASPALLVIDRRILAGYFERLNVPQQRQIF